MPLTQLSAGILAAVFSLTTIGSELVLATDKTHAQRRAEAKAYVSKDKKPRKDLGKSPWETRQMFPGGPKF